MDRAASMGTGWHRLLAVTLLVGVGTPMSAWATDDVAHVGDQADDTARAATDVSQAGVEGARAPQTTARGAEFEFSGRVFARAGADERAEWSRDLSIPSARFGVEASYEFIQAVLEADIASSSIIKDAYLALEEKSLGLQLNVGQFKAPFLARNMESRWSLPLISRGLVNDYLVDLHQLGGRRIGVLGEFSRKDWLGLKAELGVFQGAQDNLGKRTGEDLSARLSFEPWRKHLELGATAYWADAASGFGRYAVASDATVTLLKKVRLQGEGLYGRLATGVFTAQTLTASWLIGLGEAERWALEPLLGAEALQLRGPQGGTGKAGVAGVNVHYADRVKLMLQGERGLFAGDDRLRNRFALQLAARF